MSADLLNQRYPHCTVWHYSLKVPLDFFQRKKEKKNLNVKCFTIYINFNFNFKTVANLPCAKFLTFACCLQQILFKPIQFVLFWAGYIEKNAYYSDNKKRYGWVESHLWHGYIVRIEVKIHFIGEEKSKTQSLNFTEAVLCGYVWLHLFNFLSFSRSVFNVKILLSNWFCKWINNNWITNEN